MSKIAEYHRARLEAEASWLEAEYFLCAPGEPPLGEAPVGEPPGVGEPIYEPMSEIELEKLLAEGEAKRVALRAPMSDAEVEKMAAEVAAQRKAELQAILGDRRSAPAERLIKGGLRVKREEALRALTIAFPDGIPKPAALPNMLLLTAAGPHLRFKVGNDTILRAAGRKK